jgi:hypothetical protein
VGVEGVVLPAPGPGFSATPGAIDIPAETASRSDPNALTTWHFERDEIEQLRQDNILS